MLKLSELRKANILRCQRDWHHDLNGWSVAEWGNAAAGECGEACNVAKKILRFETPGMLITTTKTRDDYKKELGNEIADVLIYLDLWAASEGISLEEEVRKAFNNKSDEIGSDIKI